MVDLDNTEQRDRKTLTAMDLLHSYDSGEPISRQVFAPLSDVDQGWALQQECERIRVIRGEQVIGMKIGFTNRDLWPLFKVNHPIWAPMYRESIVYTDSNAHEQSLRSFCNPRLEPEIVFGLDANKTPASASLDDIFQAIAWIAHGYEIVQCPFEGWKFSAAEAVAAQGLHGKLIVGQRKAIDHRQTSAAVFHTWLANLKLTLRCNQQAVASGRGSNVLGSPLMALSHLITELHRRGQALPTGSVITTGTLSDVQTIHPSEHWVTEFDGSALAGLSLQL